MKTLSDLFTHFLKDIYYAESQLAGKALPAMAKSAQSSELKRAFESHQEETKGHVERLEQVFELLGIPAREVTCEALKGLAEEADEILKMEPGAVRDAGLIACAQAVEHYEIARYGALVAWARESNHADVAGILQQTLDEEKAADKKLNDLAERRINEQASLTP